MINQQLISAEQFWDLIQLPEYEGKLLELIEGEIVEMSKPGGQHGLITMQIGRLLANYVIDSQLGYVTAAETGFILQQNPDGRDKVRGIDAAFIAKETAPDGLPEGLVPFAPTLAVEVVSPGNSAESIHNKVLDLLNAGTKIIWIVYPESKTVVVHTGDIAKTLHENDALTAEELLPDFSLKISEIFVS